MVDKQHKDIVNVTLDVYVTHVCMQGMDVVTRRRHRPIRWRADEEKALLRAFIQKTITTGPAHELMLVPWTAFAGVHTHSTSACIRRINFYRTIGNLTMPPAQVRNEHSTARYRRIE